MAERWEWAGIAVRDEAGNMIIMEMDNPQGQVTVSREYTLHRGSGNVAAVPGLARLEVHLTGLARDWNLRTPPVRVRALAEHPPLPIDSGE